jgi:exodeoxyribonuclease VII small subunit
MAKPADSPSPPDPAADGQSFEDLVERLERIVEDLEGGDLRLERSLELFEEGVRISREASRRLDEAERRVEELLEDGRVAPLADEGDDDPEG